MGNLERAAVELAREWRTDKYLRQLEALLAVLDGQTSLIISGSGEIIEPDDGIVAIGSGGSFALAAARMLVKHSIARRHARSWRNRSGPPPASASTPIPTSSSKSCNASGQGPSERMTLPFVAPHIGTDARGRSSGNWTSIIIGQDAAKRSVAIALRNRWRRLQVPAGLREEIMPNNIILIGPTGVGKTEIARRLARLANAPFIKVEASKFTEVGYVGRDVESIIRDLTEFAVTMVKTEHRKGVEDGPGNSPKSVSWISSSPPRANVPHRLQKVSRWPWRTPGATREKFRQRLRAGELDKRMVELDLPANEGPLMQVVGPMNHGRYGCQHPGPLRQHAPQENETAEGDRGRGPYSPHQRRGRKTDRPGCRGA